MYSVIINYDKKNNLVWVVTLDKKLNIVHEPLMLSVGDIGSYLTKYNAQPYNYSVDSNYKIIQDNGNFDRFSALGSIVVIATYKSNRDTIDWYLALDCKSATLLKLSKAQIIKNAKVYGREYYAQNAIISGNIIKPFPKKQFFEINIPIPQKQEVDYNKILNGSLDYNDKKKKQCIYLW